MVTVEAIYKTLDKMREVCHDRKVGVRRMGNKGYSVVCGNCGGKGPYVAIKDWHDNKMIAQSQAIEAWNRRV